MSFPKFRHLIKSPHLEQKGIVCLNVAQFCGAFNDNFFKYLTLFFCLGLFGNAKSAEIFTWIGIASGLPFLLFSSASGLLADRFSKQKIIVFLKILEIFIVGLAALFFYRQAVFGSLFILFILATQSAVLGPSKYSIIPELVSKEKINRANGTITSFTYLAIIIGTSAASFFMQLTNKHFALSALLGLLIALFGLISAFFIPKTKALLSKKKPSPFIFRELYKSWETAGKTPLLKCTLLLVAFFLFIGAFIQLNLIPFSREKLQISQVNAGYLFLIAGLGLACGAYLVGKFSGKRPVIAFSSLGMLALSLSFIFLGSLIQSWKSCAFLLFFLGVFAGIVIVPFQVFIQYFSPKKTRGEMFGLDNFLSFVGAFLAPFFLYLLRKNLTLSSAANFTILGVFIFIVFVLFTAVIASDFLHIVAKCCVKPLYTSINPSHILTCKDMKTKTFFSLLAMSSRLHFYLFKEKKGFLDPLFSLLSSFDYIYTKVAVKDEKTLLTHIKTDQKNENVSCLIFKKPLSTNHPTIKRCLNNLQKSHPVLAFVDITIERK